MCITASVSEVEILLCCNHQLDSDMNSRLALLCMHSLFPWVNAASTTVLFLWGVGMVWALFKCFFILRWEFFFLASLNHFTPVFISMWVNLCVCGWSPASWTINRDKHRSVQGEEDAHSFIHVNDSRSTEAANRKDQSLVGSQSCTPSVSLHHFLLSCHSWCHFQPWTA